jgi:hypothetical protein
MGQPQITFSVHALGVLEEREIDKEWVKRVVSQPALLVPDADDVQLLHALAPIPENGGRVLRVVYNAESVPAHVVTAFFDRSARRNK